MLLRLSLAALLTAILSFIALTAPHAQFNGCPAGFCTTVPVGGGGGGYTGPLDAAVVPGAQMFYSVRSPTGAYASGSNKTITGVTNTGNSNVCDFLVATNGNLGVTSNCSPIGSDNGKTPTSYCSGTCEINTALDTSGNGFNVVQATAGNQPTLKTTSSPFTGYSTSFNLVGGSTQYWQTTSNSAFNSLSFTLIAWVNPASTSTDIGIMGGQAATPAFLMSASGGLQLKNALVTGLCTTSSTGLLTAGVWAHVAVTWSNTSPTCVFYVNGSAVATTTTGGTQTFAGNPSPWIFGGTDGDPTWNGQMAEEMVYQSALSSGQITLIYNNSISNP